MSPSSPNQHFSGIMADATWRRSTPSSSRGYIVPRVCWPAVCQWRAARMHRWCRPCRWRGCYAAVARQSPDGHLIGADERVSVEEALWMYTLGAAWVCGLESELGSISRGKRADLVFLAADPTRIPVADIPRIPVCMTMVDGVVRWRGHTPTHELCHL